MLLKCASQEIILLDSFKINPLQRRVTYLYPLKTSENLFLMFSGGIDKQHCAVMD